MYRDLALFYPDPRLLRMQRARIRVDRVAGVSGAKEPAGKNLSKHSESKGTCCSRGS